MKKYRNMPYEACEEILRNLLLRYEFLQPDSKNFDVWSHEDIEIARKHDWGK